MDNMHFEEEIQDKEYFQLKIQKLHTRVSFLEKITKEMALNKRINDRLILMLKEDSDGE